MMDARLSEVTLISSDELIKASDLLPEHHMMVDDIDSDNEMVMMIGRNAMVQSLLEACGVLQHVQVVAPTGPASLRQCCDFHDEEYLDALLNWEQNEDKLEKFNLVDDAAPFEGVEKHAFMVAGATLCAAKLLYEEQRTRVAINWTGGRHHAQRSRASGFCFINDVVLAILQLQRHFHKVLCIDVDVHHGDGIESAFLHSDRVYTCSFHQYEPGFFPGTGHSDVVGKGKGTGFNRNVCFQSWSKTTSFAEKFEATLNDILERQEFQPDVIVMVCGADGLAKDPRGGLNMEIEDFEKIFRHLLNKTITSTKLLVLGGGGYNFPETAKLWTRLTALLANAHDKIPQDIPEHDYFEQYGPAWKLS